MLKRVISNIVVALSMAGSAILLFSCESGQPARLPDLDEGKMTEYCEDLSIVMSQNGRRSYHFSTPLLEGYSQAREPYQEFRKGVKITTYQDDSLTTVDVVLTANYAIYFKERQLWEAKGDVVVTKSDGKRLYTQQLYWDAQTKKIYSNVDSKVVMGQGRHECIGEGFESNEEFTQWRFRHGNGRSEFQNMPLTTNKNAERQHNAPRREQPAPAKQTKGVQPLRHADPRPQPPGTVPVDEIKRQ